MMAASFATTIQKDNNLDTNCFIWLDASVNSSKENIRAQQQLRKSINYLLTFEDDQQCLQHIHSKSKDDRIVLIVSGKLGRIIVPQIVHLRQIISIYVYCMNRKANQQWAQHYSKVKGVIVRLDELIHQIQTDQAQQQHHNINETSSDHLYNLNVQDEEQSSSGLNEQFLRAYLLIDRITDQSLWWYIRQSFLYPFLNKALRVQNIDLLYLFRFFICHFRQELENNKCSPPIRVYRAQQISKETTEMLNNSVGEFISMNSFLSTSINRQQTRTFLVSAPFSKDTRNVFSEIDADPRLHKIKSFTNITAFRYFPEEVLFMIGSIFRIVPMERDNDGIWNIRMILCSENDHQLQTLFQYMKNELGTRSTNLPRFDDVFRRKAKRDDVGRYYCHYLNQLSNSYPNISFCYRAPGPVTYDKEDYDLSLKWYRQPLEVNMRMLKSDHPNTVNIHNTIEEPYRKKGDYASVLESYEKALIIWKKAYSEDYPDVAVCLNNMGAVDRKQEKYSKALECYQKALIIRQKRLPADQHYLSTLHNSIGIIHDYLRHYDQALEDYTLSLEITLEFPPYQHPSIVMTFTNIGIDYEDKGDFQQALIILIKPPKSFDIHYL